MMNYVTLRKKTVEVETRSWASEDEKNAARQLETLVTKLVAESTAPLVRVAKEFEDSQWVTLRQWLDYGDWANTLDNGEFALTPLQQIGLLAVALAHREEETELSEFVADNGSDFTSEIESLIDESVGDLRMLVADAGWEADLEDSQFSTLTSALDHEVRKYVIEQLGGSYDPS